MIEPQTSNPAGTSRQPDDPLDAGVDNDADPFASMPPIVFGAEFDADNALAAIGPPPPAGAAPAELPSYVSGGAVAREFFDFYDDPTPPEWWPLGAGGFAHYRFGPRSVFGIGASGGRFKTVLVMQWLWHLLRKVPDLRAVVANAETDRWEIFAREVAAYAGVPLSDVIDKRGKRRHAARVDAARRDLARLDERVAWMDTDTVAPTLAGVAAIADATGARVVVIDYLQLFDAGVDPREREPMRAMMRDVVRIARGGGGRGVLVASRRHSGSRPVRRVAPVVARRRVRGPRLDRLLHPRRRTLRRRRRERPARDAADAQGAPGVPRREAVPRRADRMRRRPPAGHPDGSAAEAARAGHRRRRRRPRGRTRGVRGGGDAMSDAPDAPTLAPDAMGWLPVDGGSAPPDTAETIPPAPATKPARARARRPVVRGSADPTNAPRWNGAAGCNAMSATVERTPAATLPPMAVLAWWELWRRADDHGRVTASINAIAARTNMSRASVKRATAALAAAGMLTRVERGSSKTHKPNLYHLDAVPEGTFGEGGLGSQ